MWYVYEHNRKDNKEKVAFVGQTYEEVCDYLDNVCETDCWFKFGYEIRDEK